MFLTFPWNIHLVCVEYEKTHEHLFAQVTQVGMQNIHGLINAQMQTIAT